MRQKLVFFAGFLFFIQLSYAYCLEANLFTRFSGQTVKVFVADVKDMTKTHDIDPVPVKTRIEAALKVRKSIKFQVVPAVEEADIMVEAQLIGFFWSDHDPVDMLVGVGAVAMDAALVEDYAAMETDVTVSDARSKNQLWRKRLFATITKKPMSKAQSVPLITDNFVKVFMRDCFSKRRN
jgi:hypothetical protein